MYALLSNFVTLFYILLTFPKFTDKVISWSRQNFFIQNKYILLYNLTGPLNTHTTSNILDVFPFVLYWAVINLTI